MCANGLGYEQCGFQYYSFSNHYVVYFYSLFSILLLSPALLIAIVCAQHELNHTQSKALNKFQKYKFSFWNQRIKLGVGSNNSRE
jgi:hypothetical protein